MFSILLIFAVWLIWNCALNQFLFQGRIQIVLAEGRSVRKSEPFHKLCSRECFIAESGENPLNRHFILNGYLVAVLIGTATNYRNLRQAVSYDLKHQFYKSCAVCLLVGGTESIIVFFLP